MKKAIIGFGGHAREVAAQIGDRELNFYVEDDYLAEGALLLSEFDSKKYEVIIGISDPVVRERIKNTLPTDTKFFTFVHNTALILDSSIKIGEGSFIGAYSIITTNVSIGNHAILNRTCHIGHDTIIGDYLTMMPGSVVSGNCTLGNSVYLGTNSSIKERISICNNVTIGLGAGIVKNITEHGTYVGLPAKKIK